MILQIPVDNYPAQKIELNVNNQDIYIQLNYSHFGGGWFFSVYKKDGTPLSVGRRIESGFPILGNVYASGFVGNFVANPISSDEQLLGLYPWGSTHTLVYYDENL
jgi:hypothetical protein